MKIIKSKSVKKPIIALKILGDESLAVVDSESTVRFLEKETLEMQSGFKASILHQRYKTPVFELSHSGEFFVTLSGDAKESRLCNTQSKKIIAKVDRHHGDVSCVGIDPLDRYMFSCGDDGKSFAIDAQSGNLVFTLPMHIDTINDIAFSKNANWVATASYDRKISLFNLVTMSPKAKLSAHSAPVTHLLFFHKNRLLSIDKSANAIIWDINTAKVVERLQGIHDDVAKVCMSADEKFLFIGTVLGYVLLYSLESYELLSSKYIKITSPITAMVFDEEHKHLILGTQDGFLIVYDIYEGLTQLKELLMKKDFDTINEFAMQNPVLASTEIYKLVSNFWEKSLEKAKLALENGDKNKALLLLQHFKNIPSKNRVIQQIVKDYEEFPKFKLFVQQGKLPLAYSLAAKYPIYKETRLYRAIEEGWKRAFAQAQKASMELRGAEKAKDILMPYRGIAEKTKLIQELLSQGEVYKRFRVSIGQKDFKISFELTKQHPFLKELPEYETLINYGDSLYVKVQELIKEGDTHSALRILKVLRDFSEFYHEVKTLTKEIESRQKFFQAIKEEDFVTAYNMMVEAEDLQETPDGIALQEEWNRAVANANTFAVEGDSKGLEKSLQKYMKINSKYMAIGTIFGWCYMVQLEQAIEEKRPQNEIENGIKNYMLNFGLQDQIENFFAYFKSAYPNSKLSLELLTQGSLSMWRPSMIVTSILD